MYLVVSGMGNIDVLQAIFFNGLWWNSLSHRFPASGWDICAKQMPGAKRAGENGQRVAFVGFQFVFRRQQDHAVQRAAQVFLQHGALFGIKGGLRSGFPHGGLNSGKTSGQYSPLADACKTASGLCRPAVIFSDGPNQPKRAFSAKMRGYLPFLFSKAV